MKRMFLAAVVVLAAAFAYERYTGQSAVQGLRSLSFGGGGGGFAGGYGTAVGGGAGAIGQSVKGVATAVGQTMGRVGN